jgi:hypothetical protein
MMELSIFKIMMLFVMAMAIFRGLNIAAIIGARIWDHRSSSLLQVMMVLVSTVKSPS